MDNDYVTFTTISSNLIPKGKSQDITDAPTTQEFETSLKKLKNYKTHGKDITAMPEAYIFIIMD